jgi:hypothetical protein
MSNNLSNDWEIVTNKSKKTQKNTTWSTPHSSYTSYKSLQYTP